MGAVPAANPIPKDGSNECFCSFAGRRFGQIVRRTGGRRTARLFATTHLQIVRCRPDAGPRQIGGPGSLVEVGNRGMDCRWLPLLPKGGRPMSISPLKAIRAKCLDCSAGSRAEVRLCPATDCPFYRFRMGRNPNRRHLPGREALNRISREKSLVEKGLPAPQPGNEPTSTGAGAGAGK